MAEGVGAAAVDLSHQRFFGWNDALNGITLNAQRSTVRGWTIFCAGQVMRIRPLARLEMTFRAATLWVTALAMACSLAAVEPIR